MKYVNPNHPCGALLPQPSGFIRGAGSYKQDRDQQDVVVRKQQTEEPDQNDGTP